MLSFLSTKSGVNVYFLLFSCSCGTCWSLYRWTGRKWEYFLDLGQLYLWDQCNFSTFQFACRHLCFGVPNKIDNTTWTILKIKWNKFTNLGFSKVQKVLKGSLDSIPSPSPSAKQTFFFQKFVDNSQQCFAFPPQANFPAYNLNFYWMWRWCDRIQATF